MEPNLGATKTADQQELYEKLARDAARLMVVHEAGRILRSSHDPEKLTTELLKIIADALFSRSGCVAALRGDRLEVLATVGLSEAEAAALVGNPAEAAFWFAVADGAEPKGQSELANEVRPAGRGAARPALSVYVPLWLEERVLGVLGLGPRVDGKAFTPADEEFLVSLASHLALALSSAELFNEKEKRIEQLGVLLKISKEITSTLELERVLVTITQMLSLVVPNRRATVALVAGFAVNIQASSDPGFDRKTAGSHPLLPALRWTLGAKKKVNTCLSALEADPKAEGRDVMLAQLDAANGPRGLAVLPLEDDQGVIGLLAIETDADAPPLDGEPGELVDILANQTTVAMRNAELYQRVPMIGMLEPLLRKARPAAAVGSRAWWIRIAAAAAVLGALLVPVPSTITADATVRPAVPIAVRASTAGTIEEVLVSEGQWVEAGAVVARMRRDELVMKLEQVRALVQRARAEAARARAAGAFADYRAREAEGASLEEQQRFLEGELSRTELVSPVRGVVLTSRVELRRGQHLERGATFLDVADVSNMIVEVSVPEQEVEGVRPGAKAQLKVYSYPERTFRGEVIRVAPRANESRTFTATVRMPNADRALRSGMSGRARLDVPARPFLWPLVAPIVRWVRMSLWV